MPDQELFNFLIPLAVKEGAWVIEPNRYHIDGALGDFLRSLRRVPSSVSAPGGERRDRFAERGETGRWLFIWVPDR